MIMNILSAITVLGVLVFVHELGHFLAAKRLGVGVIKFSIGFGPVLLSRRVGETEYCISAIPLGGFVKMVGEVDEDDPDAPSEEPQNSFAVKPVWARAVIAAAGPGFNLLFAWLLYTVLFATGVPVLTAAVGEVKVDMPAAAAGILEGDIITSVNGASIDRWEQLSDRIKASLGAPTAIGIVRDGVEKKFEITPQEVEGSTIFGEPISTWVIGVGPAGSVVTERVNPIESISQGLQKTVAVVELTVLSFAKLIQRVIPFSTVGGPIMILQIAGQQAEQGISAVLGFMALLSINLAVVNLLPIPILDGGQLTMLAVEKVLGRPMSLRAREIAMQVGFFLIISLFGFTFYNDIHRIVTG